MTIYRSENWTFISDSQEFIYNDGRTQQLPSRLSACLLTLISSAGKTVSYDDLLIKVWGTTHKDASTISSVISEVRKLIGCGKDGSKLIVTVPKRGYRFTHSVSIVDDEPLLQVTQVNEHNSESKNVVSLEPELQLKSSNVSDISVEASLTGNPHGHKHWILGGFL
jgi:DNA-binding winged helix-turn-helix (wHTH) protein